ncbi:MAG: PAS domain S-box protein [Caldithrix sp.]|nr:PAS domain S-box protein [Caldithrix sp.]
MINNPSHLERLAYFTIQQSYEPIFCMDAEGTIQYSNAAACHYTGYNYDELVGMKIYQLHPHEDAETWQRRWKRLRKQKKLSFEKWQPAAGDQWLRIKVHQNLIEMDGHPYAVSIIENRTPAYKIEEKLSESQRRLATLISNLPGMAYRCLNDAHWTMEFVSDGCETLTGYRAEDLTGNRIIDYNSMIIPEDRKRVRTEVAEKLEKNQHFEIKYRIQKQSGEVRWVWERGTMVPCENHPSQVIEGFITDITEMKKAEQALIEKEKAVRQLKDRLQEETIYLREEIKSSSNFDEIISRSNAFRRVLSNVEKVAATDTTVLILGETGTGKELIARALHNNSNRSDRSLVTVNCAALPAEMIESELFGHEKGAFTSAYTCKKGRFEIADQGTIFLDEIGDLPLNLQTKILRVLQEGEFQRVGSSQTITTDARIIAATNRDLQQAMQHGRFREDLFFRLNVFPIHVPPLRERKEDIPLLVNYFIQKFAAKIGKSIKETSQAFMNRLMAYDWPGNIRELQNIVERAVILSEDGRIKQTSLIPDSSMPQQDHITSLRENERQHILRALKATNWRVSGERGAAKLLDIKRTTLEARMKKLEIHRSK